MKKMAKGLLGFIVGKKKSKVDKTSSATEELEEWHDLTTSKTKSLNRTEQKKIENTLIVPKSTTSSYNVVLINSEEDIRKVLSASTTKRNTESKVKPTPAKPPAPFPESKKIQLTATEIAEENQILDDLSKGDWTAEELDALFELDDASPKP